MDLKPIVTCYGNKDVYDQLTPELESKLPREETEWRRSYGRPPKTVRLKAHFIRLSEGMLTSSIETASSLHKQPFFHLYWTDCQDADEYKSSVKNSITEWQRKLKVRNIVDWMIIQVVSQDSLKGNKPKIQLPRSTVFDKIKSDFGNKSNDRIIQLWESSKESQLTRAVESWQNLVTRLRQLLLFSFNRHLGKFEDRVRLLREKRTEPRWSFTTYFLLHEELSFVFEMLGLFEEALIQYDEIDALLTQLVINSNYGERLDCIDVFMRDCKCCDGVPLAKAPQEFLRQLIKTQEATYVDLRNYLFARQCNLLLRLDRPWEIAHRTLDFLHNLVHELAMDTLKITMTTGGASCCVILTCLEVLKACENKYAREEIEYSLHFALLYQYARQKLDDVGNLCALMPDMSPSETNLQTVCLLLAGIGKTQGEDTDADPNSPPKRLQEALSSKHAFQSLYLELTGLAIRIYKNIGRFRASKVLGMDLAQFYVTRGEFSRAEPLLVDAYKMYKHERWTLLVTQSLMKLAECQKQLKLMDKYASCCSVLACEQSLPTKKRFYYTQELLQVMRDTLDSAQAIVLRGEPLLRVDDVQIDLMKGIGSVGERIEVRLKLFSALQEEVTCGRISFSLQTADLKRGGSVRSSTRNRAASPVVVMETSFNSTALSEEDLSDKPPSESQTTEGERTTNVNTAEIPHPPIPTNDPPSAGKSIEELNVLADEEFDCCLQCFNVPLRHGVNEYTLTTQLAEPGHYDLKQLCVEIGRLDFVWPQLSLSRSARGFAVVADPPRISWNHGKDLQLLCGLPQQVLLRISVGPGSIAGGSVLEIASCKKGFFFQPIQSGVASIQSSLNTEDTKTSPYSIKVLNAHGDDDITHMSVAIVTLPAVGPYASIDLNLIVQAPLEEQGSQDEVTEHTLQFKCNWLSPVVTADRSRFFHRPCTVRHVLHSSGTNRLIQVIVTGITSVDIIISSPELAVKNWSAAKLTPLHRSKEYLIVNQQDMSFLWKVECGEGSPSDLECEFKTWFSPKQCPGASLLSLEKSAYLYEFRVENKQTLYTISSTVEPSEGSQQLLVGANCKLHITFTRLLQKLESSHDCSQLLYEVESDTNTWIVCGRNSGVVSIAEAAMATSDVTLEIMPLTGGNLALPNIKLMKYVEKEGKLTNAQPTGERNEGKSSSGSLVKESPVVLPFSCGQVYNRTLAAQVLVLPSNSEHTEHILI